MIKINSIGERVKQVRKQKGLTQQKFADALGVKRNTVAQWELGLNALTDLVITSICREFGVNELWLRTGDGDPYTPESRDEQIAKILSTAIVSNATARDRLIRALARLPDEAFPMIEQIILDAAKALENEKSE